MMKKWLSTLLAVSLVASMAAVLNACGGKDDKDSTTQQTTESVTEGTSGDLEDVRSFFDDLVPLEGDESYSYTELVTDEHYAEEYEKLTLPPAAPQTPAKTTKASTTRAGAQPAAATTAAERATTKAFQFSSPKDRATTAPQTGAASAGTAAGTTAAGGRAAGGNAAGGNAAAGNTSAAASTATQSTTKSGSDSTSDTTIMHDPISDQNVSFGGGTIPAIQDLPPVRYLQKYVIDILNSGSYTAKTEMVNDGIAVPMTVYKNADNMAYEMTVSDLMAATLQKEYPVLGKITGSSKIGFVAQNTSSSNPKLYLNTPMGYIDMQDMAKTEGADFTSEDLQSMFKELSGGIGDIFTKEFNTLTYVESKGSGNYWCESYVSPDKTVGYSFYFTSRGLSRIEIVDLATNQVQKITVELSPGVTNKDAFKPTGKKMDMDAIKKFVEGIS